MNVDDAKEKIIKVPPLANTIKNNIMYMLNDIKKTVTNKFSKLFFVLKIDESIAMGGTYGSLTSICSVH